MKKTFEHQDLILPVIKLPDPCPIRIEIKDDYVLLYIGQRDWQWDSETGELVGCGTTLVNKKD